MSSNVDERIVNMKINNSQFISGVKSTLSALQSLSTRLRGIGQGANGVDQLGQQAEATKSKFGALNVAAMTVVGTITNKLVTAGGSLLKSLTIDPVMQGFQEYQTNLNSIQTIMANTGKKVQVVNKYLGELNHYSDQTIYNFSQMAENIGRFTAAGVKLPKATVAIKGLANTAALSGANTMQLNSAMYQMSQALSTGTIKLMDWNSLQNANMGGSNVQKALKATALALGEEGVAMEAAIKKHGSFRDSLTEGWLTADVFTDTMEVMAGQTDKATGKTVAFSVAQLKARGYTEAQAKELNKLSQASIDAATKIKTLPQMLDVIKESVGSVFARVFEGIMGNFNQSVKLWTTVGGVITDKIGEIGSHWEHMLANWREKGGRADLLEGFKNLSQPVIAIFKALGEAWAAVFPPTTAKSLANLTENFRQFTEHLVIGEDTAEKLKTIFTGVFSLFHAAGSIIGVVFNAIFEFFGLFTGGASGGILTVAAAIGDLFKRFDEFVSGKVVDKANGSIDSFFDKFGGAGAFISDVASTIGNAISRVGDYISDLFGGLDGFDWAVIFGGATTGGALLVMKRFMGQLDNLFGNANGIVDGIKETFGALTSHMEAMTANVKAGTMLKIAGAVGILAASLLVLSNIPAEKLGKGLGAVGALMGMLVLSMMGMAKVNKSFGLVAMATALDLMAVAILALAGAVAAFGNMDPKTIAQGLISVSATIYMLVGAANLMSKYGGSFIFAAASLTILSVALGLMAGNIAIFSRFSIETLAKGIGAMGAALVVVAAAMRLMPNGAKMVLGGVGLNAVAIAITILTGALKVLSTMSVEELGKSLGALAIGLGLIAGALLLMSGTLGGSAALLLASVAIGALTASLAILATLSIEDLAKGLIALAAGLLVIIAAGAAASVVAVGLLALGAAMVMIGVGVLAAGVGIGIFAAGLAALAAAGTAAIGVIIKAILELLKILPDIAVAAAEALVSFVEAIANNAPRIVNSFVKIMSSLIDGANRLLPKLIKLFNNVLNDLLLLIRVNAPKFGRTFEVLLDTVLGVLERSIPKMVRAGMNIIEGVLEGIRDKMPRIVELGGDIIVDFINGVSDNLQRIINAGTNLVIKFIIGVGEASDKIVNAAGFTILKFLNGLNTAVKKYSGPIGAVGRDIAYNMVNGLTGGLLGWGISQVQNAVATLANAIPGPIKKILDMNSPSKLMEKFGGWTGEGLSIGIANSAKMVGKSSEQMAQASVDSTMRTLDMHSPSKVFKNLGIDVGKGFMGGIKSSIALVKAAGVLMATDALDMVTRTTTDLQLKADALLAKSETMLFLAQLKRRKANNKKLSKEQKKAINKDINALENRAEKFQKASAKSQAQQDAINAREDRERELAGADEQGKADIFNEMAQEEAERARQARQNAIQLQMEADAIRKKDKKRAKELDKQAQAALANAERAAQAAQSNAQQAQNWAVQAVVNASNSVLAELDSWLAQEAADEAYDKMTVEQKRAEMERRAAEDSQRSRDLTQSARDKLAQANALASTNAGAAQALVDAAAADVAAAQAAKDRAEQWAQEAASLAGTTTDGTSTPGGSTTTGAGADPNALAEALKMPDISIASSRVFDAQNMFDAYAKALTATSSEAEADKASVIFQQYNTSPEALSPTEVYRQTNNLLSNAERKLAGALS